MDGRSLFDRAVPRHRAAAAAPFRIEVVVLNGLAVSDAIVAIERAVATGPEAAVVVVTTLDDVVRLPRASPADLSDEADDPDPLSPATRG